MKKDKVIDKIKKCLALSKSANEHEAAAALRQAQKLMQAYAVSDIDIAMADVTESLVNVKTGRTRWRVYLVNIINPCFGVDAMLTGNTLVFIGVNGANDLAAYAYEVVSRAILNARRQYIKNNLNKVRIRHNKIARADRFCEGFVIGVRNVIKDFSQPKHDVIDQYITIKYKIQKTTVRGRKTNGMAATNDFAAGKSQGRDQKLHVPLRSGAATKYITNAGGL